MVISGYHLKEETSIWHRIDAAKLDNYCGGGAFCILT